MTRKHARRPETVYFALGATTGHIKIGFSWNVEQRLAAIGSKCGERVSLLASFPGGRNTESWFHELLVAHRIERTEWFRNEGLVPEIVAALRGEMPIRDLAISNADRFQLWKGMNGHDYSTTPGLTCPPMLEEHPWEWEHKGIDEAHAVLLEIVTGGAVPAHGWERIKRRYSGADRCQFTDRCESVSLSREQSAEESAA